MSGPLPVILLAVAGMALFAACGDDGDGSRPQNPDSVVPTPTARPRDTTTEPALSGPASKYAVSQLDLDPGFLTDIPSTYVLNAANYSGTKAFNSAAEGQTLLKQWGYVDGYETGYLADGGQAAVLNGNYFFWVEAHLFKDAAGARAAYAYIASQLGKSVSEKVTAYQVGNESSAWKVVGEPVGDSTIPSALHRVVFRRGNLVAVIATWGANPLMTVHTATDLAVIVDEKALGERDAPVPTPTSNYTPPSYDKTPTVKAGN